MKSCWKKCYWFVSLSHVVQCNVGKRTNNGYKRNYNFKLCSSARCLTRKSGLLTITYRMILVNWKQKNIINTSFAKLPVNICVKKGLNIKTSASDKTQCAGGTSTLTPHSIWYNKYGSVSWSETTEFTCFKLATVHSMTKYLLKKFCTKYIFQAPKIIPSMANT